MKLQQNISVQHITLEQALPLRMRILRPGQAIENSLYPQDRLSTTLYWGVLANEAVVCTGTFFKDSCSYFPDEKESYRLRGMATDPEFQGQDLGSLLIKTAEQNIKLKGGTLLWCDARDSAISFYEKNGFKTIGDLFSVPGTGPHIVMFKKL